MNIRQKPTQLCVAEFINDICQNSLTPQQLKAKFRVLGSETPVCVFRVLEQEYSAENNTVGQKETGEINADASVIKAINAIFEHEDQQDVSFEDKKKALIEAVRDQIKTYDNLYVLEFCAFLNTFCVNIAPITTFVSMLLLLPLIPLGLVFLEERRFFLNNRYGHSLGTHLYGKPDSATAQNTQENSASTSGFTLFYNSIKNAANSVHDDVKTIFDIGKGNKETSTSHVNAACSFSPFLPM